MAKKKSTNKNSTRKQAGQAASNAVRKVAKKAASKTAPKVAEKVAKKTAGKVARKTVRAAGQPPADPATKAALPVTDLATAAYLIYLERLEKGLPGDALSDWAAAERSIMAA